MKNQEIEIHGRIDTIEVLLRDVQQRLSRMQATLEALSLRQLTRASERPASTPPRGEPPRSPRGGPSSSSHHDHSAQEPRLGPERVDALVEKIRRV
jgi:hypothetical protein